MSDMITIKKIEVPKEFRKENMLRRLIKFESGTRDVVMYEVIRENWEHGTGHRGYEVMIVRYMTKDVEYFGNITPAGSPLLPSNEQFGQYGWSFNRFESADKKFKQLLVEPVRKGGRKSNVIFI
jgi:hypothetical protein